MAKKNNGYYLKMMMWAAGIIFAAAGVCFLAKTNAGRIAKAEVTIEKCRENIAQNKNEITAIERDLYYIKKLQEQILAEIKELRKND